MALSESPDDQTIQDPEIIQRFAKWRAKIYLRQLREAREQQQKAREARKDADTA